MEIIVPAAGLSTRFPNTKPKYLLYDYGHKMMIQRALDPWLKTEHNITVGVLKQHDEKFNSVDFLKYEFGDRINVVILEEMTEGPADTVYKIIKKSNIDLTQQLLVKDCDSFFHMDKVETENFVCTSNIADHEVLKKLSSKSFVIKNEQGIITSIIEKKVVSDTFCVGGCGFKNVQSYCDTFEQLKKSQTNREIFVSDVISKQLEDGEIFSSVSVKNYTDVGTQEDWHEYNNKPVIFCDIDGTLIVSQSRVGQNNFYSSYIALEKTVNKLLDLQKNGAQFIFVTSRPKNLERQTHNLLTSLGFKNYELIIGLQNSTRILINDFNNANPHPRAISINVERDKDQAWMYL